MVVAVAQEMTEAIAADRWRTLGSKIVGRHGNKLQVVVAAEDSVHQERAAKVVV